MRKHLLNEYCTTADYLLKDVKFLERKLREAQERLQAALVKEKNCDHSWDPPRAILYDPHYINGAETPIVQKEKIDYPISHWSRFCNKCGAVQKTQATKEEVHTVPDFAIPLNEV